MTIERTTLRYRLDWPLVRDFSARVYFNKGSIDSCSVGLREYTKLKEGDVVNVALTHTVRSCVIIKRNDEVIESGNYWKLTTTLFGVLIVFLGLFGRESQDDGDNSYID